MLVGEHRHSLDDKGRLFIPAKLREELGSRFVLTRGMDTSLFIYPLSEWELLQNKLKSLSFTRGDVRSFTRFFFSGAVECELDKQGRINIPPNLRNYAQLERECVIIGVSNRVEIWSESQWQQYFAQAEESFEEIAEKLDLEL